MKLLLDTHVFIWFCFDSNKLPDGYVEAIREPSNQPYVSIASGLEIAIKHAIGKLPIPEPIHETLFQMRSDAGCVALPIDEGILPHIAALPLLHRDPFDRILIAQANQHGMKLMTVDQQIRQYPQAPLFTP